MKKLTLLSLALAACTSQTAGNQSQIKAGVDAQRFGVYAYAVQGDTVTMFDRDGVEYGRVAVSSPASDRRVFTEELTDGTLDDAEVYQPMSDGRFFVTLDVETPLTAALTDQALASVWANYGVRARANVVGPTVDALTANAVATTTSCTTPSSDTPQGCARPANTSVGCTNPTQLPASIIVNTMTYPDVPDSSGYISQSWCIAYGDEDCAALFGGTAASWAGSYQCRITEGLWDVYCGHGTTENNWTASCPKVSCGINGQYDAVPRRRTCTSPGSCTKYQGTVGCTPYH
jgi:hypothetical protein